MSVSIDIQRTRSPRLRPAGGDLGFGRHFTDHMFLLDHDAERGWHAPRIVPYGPLQVDPAACGLHYGQTIFEGLKAFFGVDGRIRVFRMGDHLARLNASARRLCIPPVAPELLEPGLRALLALDADWMPEGEGTSLYVRPLVFATEGFLGVRPSRKYTLCAFVSPVGDYYAAGAAPVKIWVEQKRTRAAHGGLGAAKTGANYAASMKAAEEARARGFAQVLWLDAREHRWVEEVGTMNLFAQLGDEVVTPPLEGTLLAGITRASVLTLLREWGVPATERRLAIDELQAAQAAGTLREIFGTGTAAVISPVGELGFETGNLVVAGGKPGPLAPRLRQAILDIQYGRAPDRHGWLSEVEALEVAA
jgi:branched-chain amino acid aminotransferase